MDSRLTSSFLKFVVLLITSSSCSLNSKMQEDVANLPDYLDPHGEFSASPGSPKLTRVDTLRSDAHDENVEIHPNGGDDYSQTFLSHSSPPSSPIDSSVYDYAVDSPTRVSLVFERGSRSAAGLVHGAIMIQQALSNLGITIYRVETDDKDTVHGWRKTSNSACGMSDVGIDIYVSEEEDDLKPWLQLLNAALNIRGTIASDFASERHSAEFENGSGLELYRDAKSEEGCQAETLCYARMPCNHTEYLEENINDTEELLIDQRALIEAMVKDLSREGSGIPQHLTAVIDRLEAVSHTNLSALRRALRISGDAEEQGRSEIIQRKHGSTDSCIVYGQFSERSRHAIGAKDCMFTTLVGPRPSQLVAPFCRPLSGPFDRLRAFR